MGHIGQYSRNIPSTSAWDPRLPRKGGSLWKTGVILLIAAASAVPGRAREKDITDWGVGLIVNVPFPESDVSQAVEEVVQNGIIRGTKEYNKDEYITGATSTASSRAFPAWNQGGKIFYKVRLKALDPRNFKDSGDVGTLTVRYILQPQGDKNTVLHIDAIYVEDFRRVAHKSNGSVESEEYKDIHDHLEAMNLMKEQAAEAERVNQQRRERMARDASANSNTPAAGDQAAAIPAPTTMTAVATPGPKEMSSAAENGQPAVQTLEERVKSLRRQVERRVKSPGAPLKSAPFRSANTLSSLAPGAEVLIVVSTPYWLGVETHDGQHGWILQDNLELVP
jgi:hypothetical protein